MIYVLDVIEKEQLVDSLTLGDPYVTNTTTTFRVHRSKLGNLWTGNERRRRRARPARQAVERFLDPEREHPLLKKLMSTVAPLAISFLTEQLPEWLGDIDLTGSPTSNGDGH